MESGDFGDIPKGAAVGREEFLFIIAFIFTYRETEVYSIVLSVYIQIRKLLFYLFRFFKIKKYFLLFF